MALMANRLRRGLQVLRPFSTAKLSSFSCRESCSNPQKLCQLWSLSRVVSRSQFVMGGVRGVSNLRPLYSPVDTDGSKGGRGDTILFEGCDYEHWLVTMEFPDPQPSREEKIDTFIKTLAKVVGSEEESKKKIYALSTTTYTGFQAQISEETSEKLKGLPGVVWVLPDSYIDPVNKEYGGDKYIDGVIIPDTRVYNNRPSGRYNDRPRNRIRRDSMPVERRNGLQGDGRDFRPPMEARAPMQGDGRDLRTMEGRGPMQGGDRQDYRPPPIPGDKQEYRQDYRPPPISVDKQEYRQDYRPPPPPIPGDKQEYRQDYRPPPNDWRGPMPGYGQDHRPPPVDWRGPMPGYGQDHRTLPVDARGPTPGYGQEYRPPLVDVRGPTPGYGQDYRPTPVDARGSTPGYAQDYMPPPMDGRWSMPGNQQESGQPPSPMDVRGPMPADRQYYRQDYRPPMDARGTMPGYHQDYRPPMDARGTMPGYTQDYRPPMDGRGPSSGYREDYRPSMDGRGPSSAYRQDYRPPMDGRGLGPNDRRPMEVGPIQQETRDYEHPREPMQGGIDSAQGRDPGQVDQQPFPWPMEGAK